MKEQDNLKVAQDSFDAWNRHDVEGYQRLLADEFVQESDTLPEPVRGRDQAGEMMRMYLRAFPDLRFTIEQMVASGDHVFTRWKSIGTHKGDLMGMPPTGRTGELHGCEVLEVRNGKIIHDWSYWDSGALMRQLS